MAAEATYSGESAASTKGGEASQKSVTKVQVGFAEVGTEL